MAPLTSLLADESEDGVEGNGEVIKQDRSVKPFTKLEVAGIFDVIITQGSKETVTVETDENLQDFVVVENDGNKLTLSSNHDVKIKKATKMIVHVTITNISDLTVAGIGDVSSKGTIKLDDFTVEIAGVGDATLDLSCESLNLNHSGVGDVNLNGNASTAYFEYQGVGEIFCYDFTVRELAIMHSGVGTAEVFVTEKLIVESTGVGSVFYKGNPGTKKISNNGIGSVKAK